MESGADLSDASDLSDLSDLSDSDFFWWGMKIKPCDFGELQGLWYLWGIGCRFLDCFFVEHCSGGFGFVCVGFVFAVEADALVDDVEFHVFNCSVGHVAYTCGG